jgi:hypothetical protein
VVFSNGVSPPHRGDGAGTRKSDAFGKCPSSSRTPQSNQEHAARDSAAEQLPFHPLADLFPLMEGAEFDALVADIKTNALRTKITLYEGKILDGRNRYRAMLAAGHTPLSGHFYKYKSVAPGDTPLDYVIRANLHRRHLTAEQRRDVIAKLLKEQPEKSNRQIAKVAKVDHHKVGKVRKEEEDVGKIPHVDKLTDTKGRKQPARKLSEKKRRRTPEEIGVDRFKHGIEYMTLSLETVTEALVVPQQLSTEVADWAIEQIRCGELALRAIANRIKQVRSGAAQ